MNKYLFLLTGFCLVSFNSCLNENPASKNKLLDAFKKYSVSAQVSDKLYSIPVNHVKVNGEIGRRIDVTMDNNIKGLDLDNNFTNHFQDKQGPDVVGAFIGMGMLIDACVRFAAYSNDPEMISIKKEIIDKVINSQLDNGYVGFYKSERRLWNNSGGGDNWDIHEMAFIIDGLITDYQMFGSERSLEAAIKTADFIISHWEEMPDDYAKRVDMHVLDTGIDWAILKLYKVTGEKRFLNFSTSQKPLEDWDTEIVIGRRLGVSGHMFAYFAMCQAQLELYRLSSNSKLLQQTENAIDFLTANDGLTISGSAGIREIWTDDQDGDGELGETCATSYQLRIYENLLRLYGDSKYGDLIERTVLNGLFAAQSPDGQEIRYYTPFEGQRHYYPHEHMCCPGNFRRIISELPTMIYYITQENGIAVNLYTASQATIDLADNSKVFLQQETDYPNSGLVQISVSPSQPRSFQLQLRIPAWAKSATVSVNGVKWEKEPVPGTFLSIDRKWAKNDKVKLEMPMDWRFVNGRKRQAGRVAIMRGPVIYCFSPSANPAASLNGERTFNDLRRLQLDPTTLSAALPSNTIRPNGLVGYINGWRENHSGLADGDYEFKLELTEFVDPDGKLIYFKLPDFSIGVDDELIKIIKKDNIES